MSAYGRDVGNFHGASTADALLNREYLDRKPALEDRARAAKAAPSLTAWFRDRFPELSPGGGPGGGSGGGSSLAVRGRGSGGGSGGSALATIGSSSSSSSSSGGGGSEGGGGNGTEGCDPRGGGCDGGGAVGWEAVAGGGAQDEWKSLVENLLLMVCGRAHPSCWELRCLCVWKLGEGGVGGSVGLGWVGLYNGRSFFEVHVRFC